MGTSRIIQVKISCNAKTSQIIGYKENILHIRLHAIPEKGKANAALISLLSEHFCVPKSQITILRGLTNSRKTIEIKE